jgi:hypothetical protein
MIRSKILSFQVAILIIVGVTACISTPGIGSPIMIDGTEFQVTSASMQDSYRVANEEYSPASGYDAFLIVEAETPPTGVDVEISDWEVQVQDENGRIDDPSITRVVSGIVDTQEGNFLEWAFVVYKDAQSYTLVIQGYEIVLDSILETESSAD